MHKIIFIIILLTSINAHSEARIQIESQADFVSGQSIQADHSGKLGRISILSVLGIGTDSFDFLNKGLWNSSGYFSLLTANAKLSIQTTDAVLTSAGTFDCNEFQLEITLEPYSSGLGEFYLQAQSGSKYSIWMQDNSNTFSVFGGSPIVGVNAQKFRLVRSGSLIHGYYLQDATKTWALVATTTTASSTHTFVFGRVNGVSSQRFHAYDLKITPYLPTASWTSPVYDLTATPTTLGSIAWDQELPAGTRIDIQTSSSHNGTAWTAWSAPYGHALGSPMTSPPARYLRVSAILYADTALQNTPYLEAIRIHYPDANPSVPVLTPLSHPPALWSTPTALQLSWAMPPGNPAPEASYTYWLRRSGILTATASAAIAQPVGLPHPLSISLPQEGEYTFDLQVTADAVSGGRTVSAQTYSFGYDASAPSQVEISSPTHPALLFTNNRNPVFNLLATDAVSGVSGYAAVLDKAPTGDPGALINAGPELRLTNIDNGTWYLHARAIDLAGNAGPVTHYGIRVDFNGALLSPDYVKALPNPVRTDTAKLEYELAAPATEVTLEFLNSQGELLKTVDGAKVVGKNYYAWNLGALANGVYLFRVKARSAEDGKWTTVVRKVAVIR